MGGHGRRQPDEFDAADRGHGEAFADLQAEQIDQFRAAWVAAGHRRTPRVSVSRSIFPLVTDLDRRYFGPRGDDSADQVGIIDGFRSTFGKTYAAEPDVLVEQLKADAAVQSADTLMLTIPSQLGVDLNLHILELRPLRGPALGWEPNFRACRRVEAGDGRLNPSLQRLGREGGVYSAEGHRHLTFHDHHLARDPSIDGLSQPLHRLVRNLRHGQIGQPGHLGADGAPPGGDSGGEREQQHLVGLAGRLAQGACIGLADVDPLQDAAGVVGQPQVRYARGGQARPERQLTVEVVEPVCAQAKANSRTTIRSSVSLG